MKPIKLVHFLLATAGFAPLPSALPQGSFVNWETPHVHPLDLTPDGERLLAVNLADNRLEVFDIRSGSAVSEVAVPVGLDPVSVRVRSNSEAWVVNHISDTVSIVDLTTRHVRATLQTDDEPADVIFAGSPERAYVSCAQPGTILVFDPSDLSVAPVRLEINGEEPRALAKSSDGQRVFCAIFESGNLTTTLGNGGVPLQDYPPDVVGLPAGPYGGVNPPPNDGADFEPTLNPALPPPPPPVALIVRSTSPGSWLDDNGTEWGPLVDGDFAIFSGREPGWSVADNDVVVIETSDLSISYAKHAMNMCMDLAVHPASGEITVVGTDATNEIRYEPVLKGRFLRVNLARIDALALTPTISDLNGHLDYAQSTVAQGLRDQTLSDPRAIVWSSDGTRGYISGMGTNNVLIVDANGDRVGLTPLVEVGAGPTGLALDEARSRLYVMNKFEGSISVIDISSPSEAARVPFFDPTPQAIKVGRPHLYDAHETSGLGLTSCAACHVDARWDRLAWDLGDPAGDLRPLGDENLEQGLPGTSATLVEYHPMKGPMLTQTLQDIIGKEPFHWRGDRAGIEEFNGAFESLMGDDEQLSNEEMAEFKAFLATIFFPPNPFRNSDNSLATDVEINEFSIGKFSPAGTPLPNGDAANGLGEFNNACGRCHTLPTGLGTNKSWDGALFQPIPAGANGEDHHSVMGPIGSVAFNLKVPQLRSIYKRTGSNNMAADNRVAYGLRHDGAIDSLARFVSRSVFPVENDQEVADIIAFVFSMSGETEISTVLDEIDTPPGDVGQGTHAAVGMQMTVDQTTLSTEQQALLLVWAQEAQEDDIAITLRVRLGGVSRGGLFLGNGNWQLDRRSERTSLTQLLTQVGPGAELTLTVVPFGSGTRIGLDRDSDGFYDRDERDGGSDPADPDSRPRIQRRRL